MMNLRNIGLCCLAGITTILTAQQKRPFTLEQAFKQGTFRTSGVAGFKGMNDGEHFTSIKTENDNWSIVKQKLGDGTTAKVILKSENLGVKFTPDDYQFNSNETGIVFTWETESIYRHSSRSNVCYTDIATGKTIQIPEGKVMYPQISPDSKNLAYVRDNNLYIFNLETGKEMAITSDGERNKIINGAVDWVYEEEFSMSKGYEWSPDGDFIAFYRFDESEVKEFSMDVFSGLYPAQERWKYPKAGEDNSKVDVFIYELNGSKLVKAEIEQGDRYLPRIQWSNVTGMLSIQWLNRTQNEWALLFADARSGAVNRILEEKSNTYVDIHDNLRFLKSKSGFISTSEKDGFNHIYHYVPGKVRFEYKQKRITQGDFDVIGIQEIDEQTGLIYYTSSEVSPTEDHLFSIDFNGKKKSRLTADSGHHSVSFGFGTKYFLDIYSRFGQPPCYLLKKADGSFCRNLENNQNTRDSIARYQFGATSFGSMKTDSGIALNYWMIKPYNFEPGKKYPVLMFVYGGPGVNTVRNSWGGRNYLYHQYLAQKGYIVVSVDGRGTGNRGEKFKKCTYLNLGNLEHADQAAAARWLATQSYVDPKRIGIWGWSFGGYMSSLCITKSAELFKTAIAVAPVTNWRYYDNIYTERFLRKPEENASGYDNNSPINFVKNIKGNYLIIHGTGDDNVHWQNSAEMINAMIKAGVKFDSEVYPNRNHGIGDRAAQYHLYRRMAEYIQNNL